MYVLQALIIRDNAMLWVLSIGFELMELTFQHMLPNFNECWWDSWILDVAVCNWIGAARPLIACLVAKSPMAGCLSIGNEGASIRVCRWTYALSTKLPCPGRHCLDL